LSENTILLMLIESFFNWQNILEPVAEVKYPLFRSSRCVTKKQPLQALKRMKWTMSPSNAVGENMLVVQLLADSAHGFKVSRSTS
jgi:hypothetical protein